MRDQTNELDTCTVLGIMISTEIPPFAWDMALSCAEAVSTYGASSYDDNVEATEWIGSTYDLVDRFMASAHSLADAFEDPESEDADIQRGFEADIASLWESYPKAAKERRAAILLDMLGVGTVGRLIAGLDS